MTPRDEQYDAILALAELVEIDALDPDTDLPWYLAQALNLHPDDIRADPDLTHLMHTLTAGTDPTLVARQMLDYIR